MPTLGQAGLRKLFFVPPNPTAFVGGFFLIPRVTGVISTVLSRGAVGGAQVSMPLSKGISFGLSLVAHVLMKNSFSLGWMLGELNDMAVLGGEALANALAPRPAGMSGIIGRRFGQDVGGIIGRQFGQDVGQVGGGEVEELRRLREKLSGGGGRRPLASANGNRAVLHYAN